MSATDEARKLGYIVWNVKDILRCFPRKAFGEETASLPPDYSSLDSWSAHPDRQCNVRAVEDANWLAAPSIELSMPDARPCDCFFVHDSCMCPAESMPFLGDCAPRWNAPLRADLVDGSPEAMMATKINEQVDLRVAAGASGFNNVCRIYAPRYRQTNVMAYFYFANVKGVQAPILQRTADARKAFDVAYNDVRRAFEAVVDHPANAGRPFILAGHSQGSNHLLRLLQEEVEPRPDRLRRFVHAYLAGNVVPLDLFRRTLHAVRPSEGPEDIRSVSSWRTGRRGHSSRVRQSFDMIKYLYYADRGRYRYSKAQLLSTNPVTWSSERGGQASSPEQFRGAFWPSPENMDARDHAGIASCGVNLRFGHAVAKSRDTLGVEVRQLSKIDVEQDGIKSFSVRVDELGTTQVSDVPRDSLFGLAERDWLLYHDLDFAIFHGNIRENASLRCKAWSQAQCNAQFQSRL